MLTARILKSRTDASFVPSGRNIAFEARKNHGKRTVVKDHGYQPVFSRFSRASLTPRPLLTTTKSAIRTNSNSDLYHENARIKAIGVGGGGGNALSRMVEDGLQGVEFWVVNTDAQVLGGQKVPNKLQIGSDFTRGLGCGGSPELGARAASESAEELKKILEGADLVFVAAGMGGGTGTGAAPVVADIAKQMGILTVAVVTHPFNFEGKRRAAQAIEGIAALRKAADCVIIVPNERLLEVAKPDITLQDAFALADEVLQRGVQGISDTITAPGLINVDFADVKAVMTNSGTAMLGIGKASGPDRAQRVAYNAITNPLLLKSIERATGIVYNVTGGSDMTLQEVNFVSQVLTEKADPSCNIIFGSVVDEAYQGTLHMTIIATGFPAAYEEELFDPNAVRKPTELLSQGSK